MCAVMVLVIGAPLVTADTHHVVKGAQGPRASAVSWNYTATDNGAWVGHITNSGLRSLVVDVDDVTSGVASSILHQRIRFAAYPSNVLDSERAVMTAGHDYAITVTPNGVRGSYCDVEDVFIPLDAPIASFTFTAAFTTVSVDGSASMDPDGTIVAWGWEWGDGTTGTGVTATHTYAASGVYTIVLTVMDNDGLTGSVSHDVSVIDHQPVAAFTTSVVDMTVTADALTSTDDQGITSYAWAWGDGASGTGVIATHTYAAADTYTITLTVTDTIGQTNSVSHDVTIQAGTPPIADFTGTASSGGMLHVDGSPSSSSVGIARYDWNFGDNIIASGSIHDHKYVATGTYDVTLTVTDNNGLKASVTKSFAVTNTALPPLPFTVYGNTLTGGGSPVAGAAVSVTNVRTGETLIGNVADATGFYYINDVMPLYFVAGDTLIVSAVSGALTGSMSVLPDFNGQPFLQVDVVLV